MYVVGTGHRSHRCVASCVARPASRCFTYVTTYVGSYWVLSLEVSVETPYRKSTYTEPDKSSAPDLLRFLFYLPEHLSIFYVSVPFSKTEPFFVTSTMTSLCDLVPPGVVTGDDLMTLFEHARTNGYAIPAVNCTRYASKAVLCVGYLETRR
jgi:hypothetical protein